MGHAALLYHYFIDLVIVRHHTHHKLRVFRAAEHIRAVAALYRFYAFYIPDRIYILVRKTQIAQYTDIHEITIVIQKIC